jgi:hypothetical protein
VQEQPGEGPLVFHTLPHLSAAAQTAGLASARGAQLQRKRLALPDVARQQRRRDGETGGASGEQLFLTRLRRTRHVQAPLQRAAVA